MYTSFLVPFDGSQTAYNALATAVGMGRAEENIDVAVLCVLKMAEANRTSFDVAWDIARLASGSPQDPPEKSQQLVQRYFEGLPENVDLSIVVKRGNPADVICQYAADNGVDCIVMGRRGLGGIRAVLGSVSAGVLRGTDLPVLVVK